MPASPGDHDRVARELETALRPDHPGDEAEVGGEAVIESIDHVAEEPAGAGAVPWLSGRSAHVGQGTGVLLGLLRQPKRGGRHRSVGRRVVQPEVPLHLTPLLGQQQGQQHRPTQQPGEPGPESGGDPGPGNRDRMSLLRQQLPPLLDVPVLHPRQLEVELGPPGIGLRAGQLPVEEGGVGFVLEVVEPGRGRRGHGGKVAICNHLSHRRIFRQPCRGPFPWIPTSWPMPSPS